MLVRAACATPPAPRARRRGRVPPRAVRARRAGEPQPALGAGGGADRPALDALDADTKARLLREVEADDTF
jgi:hypothetical protein